MGNVKIIVALRAILINKFQFVELKKTQFTSIKTYKLLTIKLLYSMFLINYYIGAFVWK